MTIVVLEKNIPDLILKNLKNLSRKVTKNLTSAFTYTTIHLFKIRCLPCTFYRNLTGNSIFWQH